MPLVRIDVLEGLTDDELAAIGDGVHRAMVETIAVPALDRFQVIRQHPPGALICDPEYLGIRPQDVFVNVVEVVKENWSFGNGVAPSAA